MADAHSTQGDAAHKVCSKCGESKPLTLEYFHFARRRGAWYPHCKACHRAMCKSNYEGNKEAYHARARAFEKANPQWQSERNKKYRQENKDKINERLKNRRKSDVLHCVERRTRVLIADTIRRNGFTKRHRASKILGCDWGFFKAHIERQFLSGMSWENRDQWHIDHIIPIATAKTEEDVVLLNHFTNLRPLWAKENIAKGDRLEFLI